jgi:hypothetical protein
MRSLAIFLCNRHKRLAGRVFKQTRKGIRDRSTSCNRALAFRDETVDPPADVLAKELRSLCAPVDRIG